MNTRKRNFYFFHKENFYVYREDLNEEAVIIEIITTEKHKKGICKIIYSQTIGAVSGIETFAMGVSAKMFKWQIIDAVELAEQSGNLKSMEGNIENIKEFIYKTFESSKKEALDDVLEVVDDNSSEMELKEKKRFSLFGKK